MSRIQHIFHNVDVSYIYAAQYINFLKYNDKSFIVGSDMMSRIQNTFHNVDVYYFYAAPYINFLKYNEKSFTVGNVIMRQNSEHLSER